MKHMNRITAIIAGNAGWYFTLEMTSSLPYTWYACLFDDTNQIIVDGTDSKPHLAIAALSHKLYNPE